MSWESLYEYGVTPLTNAKGLEVNKKYVTTNGDVVMYNGDGNISIVKRSPLAVIEGNTVENLTELQLSLYWSLCRTENRMEND